MGRHIMSDWLLAWKVTITELFSRRRRYCNKAPALGQAFTVAYRDFSADFELDRNITLTVIPKIEKHIL